MSILDPVTKNVTETRWEHSSLSATECRIILQGLDLKTTGCYSGALLILMEILWALQNSMVTALHVPTTDDRYMSPQRYTEVARLFGQLFVTVMDSNFTPYMHDNVDHVGDMLERHGTIFQFDTQIPELKHKVNFNFNF